MIIKILTTVGRVILGTITGLGYGMVVCILGLIVMERVVEALETAPTLMATVAITAGTIWILCWGSFKILNWAWKPLTEIYKYFSTL